MQKSQVENVLNNAAASVGILVILLILTGCGGGGSGSPPTLNYTGMTPPVAINGDNAYNMLTGVYAGEQTTAVLNVFGASQVETPQLVAAPDVMVLTEIFASFINRMDMQTQESAPYAGAIITDSETLEGSCGGSVYYDVGIDNIFGEFSGTADFREYCDDANPDLVLDGVTDFSGDYEILSQEIEDFTFIFRDLAGMTSEGSFTLNGRLDGNVSTSRAEATTNSVIQDDATGKTYWLDDFKVTVLKGASYVDMTLSGRYYDYDYGYVDVTTEEPLRVNNNNDWPASGVIVLTGAEGEFGGQTMARMEVLDTDYFQIVVDDDGDGEFDDYDSGPLPWTEI